MLQIAIVALCTMTIVLLSHYTFQYRRDAFYDWNNVLFPDNQVRIFEPSVIATLRSCALLQFLRPVYTKVLTVRHRPAFGMITTR